MMKTSWIKEIRIFGGRLSIVNTARIGSILIVLILAVSSIYGYDILRTIPGVESYVPELGIAAAGMVLFWVYNIRKQLILKEIPFRHSTSLSILIFLTVLTIAGTIAFAEWMIVTPAERIHVIKYCLLGIFLFYSFKDKSIFQRLLLAVGFAEETLQYYLPYRVGELRDVLLDGVCAAFGSLFAWLSAYWLTYRK